ncbi:hypothetical protein H2248_006418 [Termitomyces sp. 'cryptogamus']|nr:hypothetical protein H2248_006418 [Termitomyces sp. 'cryptogamus']
MGRSLAERWGFWGTEALRPFQTWGAGWGLAGAWESKPSNIDQSAASDSGVGDKVETRLPLSRPVPRNPAHRPSTPRTPKGTPNAPLNFRPCPAPTSANSDASPANSDGPLANFGACPAATDTYPGPPEPREPPPLFPIFATHHQLNTLVRTSLFARSWTPSAPNDLPSKPGSAPTDHTAASFFASANPPYGLLPEPRQDRLVSSQSNFSGPPRICLDHIPPTTRMSHHGPERLRVFGYQCKGITPA